MRIKTRGTSEFRRKLQNINVTFDQIFFVYKFYSCLTLKPCGVPPPRRRLEKMIEALLSMLRETEVLDAIPSLIQVLENFTGSLVKVTHAENGRSKLDAALVSQPMAKTRFLFAWISSEHGQTLIVSSFFPPFSAAAEPPEARDDSDGGNCDAYQHHSR